MSLPAVDLAAPAPPTPADLLRWTGFGGALLLTGSAWVGAGRPSPGVGTASLACGVAGVGLVVLSWVLLGRAIPDSRWLRWTLALWCAPLLLAPPLFSGDVFSYLAQGEIAARGLDPHAVGPASGLGAASEVVARVGVHWRDTPSPYGPLFGVVERLVARLSAGDPVTGVLLHRLVGLAGLALVVRAVPRLAARTGASPRAALWLGVLNPLVLWHLVAGAHNDALMLGLVLAGTVAALGERVVLGIALISLAALVKLPALAALAVVGTVLARRGGGGVGDLLRAGAGVVASFAVVAAAVSLSSGLGFGWVRALGTAGRVESWLAPTNWFGFLTGGIGSLFGARITQEMIAVGRVAGAALAVCGVAFVLLGQLRGRVDAVASLGLALGLVVVLGPVVQPWYVLWALVPLAACRLPTRAWTGLTGLVAVFAVLVPPQAGDFSGRVGQLVTGYAVGAALVGAVFLALREKSKVHV